ncbi:MAG: site-2 protease family protein [Lachnospiraceae bacterium]|nr:site-2 protease family protein [Lachnospiraceae bacterium]
MSVIIFLIMLGVLVVFHEWGHFLTARANKITVKEFWIGIGPTLLAWGKGETRFKIKLLPLGGACVFEDDLETQQEGSEVKEEEVSDPSDHEETAGENAAENGAQNAAQEQHTGGKFMDASVGARFFTVIMGPLFNFILAYLMALILVGNSYVDEPVLQDVRPGFPAAEAGMQPGDVFTSVGGHSVYLAREIAIATQLHAGETTEFTYERDGKEYSVTLTPKKDEETGRMLYGFEGYAEYVDCGFWDVIPHAYYEVRLGLYSTLESLKMLIFGKLGVNNLAGPVGMAKMVGDVTEQSRPYGLLVVILNLISMTMLLSVNLGVMNLLPIPGLDGGRLLFIIVEFFRGRPIPPEKENYVHMAGFVLLFALMLFTLYQDIVRIWFS